MWIFYFVYVKTRAGLHLPWGNKPTFCLQDNIGEVSYLHYENNGEPIITAWNPSIGPKPDFFISDTIPRAKSSAKTLQLHVVSAGNPNMDFQSLMTGKRYNIRYLFPPFTREEYFFCDGVIQVGHDGRNIIINEEELHIRYDIFGGCLRLLRAYYPADGVPKALRITALNELNSFFSSVHARNGQFLVTQYEQLITECARTIAMELERIENTTAASKAKLTTLFQHSFKTEIGEKDQCASSKFMEYFGATLLQNSARVPNAF